MNDYLQTFQNLLNKASSDEGIEFTIALSTDTYVKLFSTITLAIVVSTALAIIFKNFFKVK